MLPFELTKDRHEVGATWQDQLRKVIQFESKVVDNFLYFSIVVFDDFTTVFNDFFSLMRFPCVRIYMCVCVCD